MVFDSWVHAVKHPPGQCFNFKINSMLYLILSVQSTGHDSYRLGVNIQDSKQIFVRKFRTTQLNLGSIKTKTHTTCGPPPKRGFDLSNQEINRWIKKNNFHIYPTGYPTKIGFYLVLENNEIFIIFDREIKLAG